MKKIAYLILYSLGFVLMGCVSQEKDIFSSSPIERLTAAMSDDATLLQSAENGWAMEYFATPKSAGYTLFAKFTKSGKVIVSGKSELTGNVILSDSSFYDMVGDTGPVLTFNSYNKVLHAFSNPENPNGFGLEGDYEFVVISTSADLITLKGKKRGTTILMRRVPTDVAWSQYIADTEAVNAVLFTSDTPALTMKLSDYYSFSDGGSRIFSVLKFGANSTTTVLSSFIFTRTGIRFHAVQNFDGKSFQTFTLNPQKSALVCDEDPSLSLVGPDLASYFATDIIHEWAFDSTRMSPSVKATYNLLVQSLVTKYKATNIKLSMRYEAVRSTPVLKISFKENVTMKKLTTIGNLDFGISADGREALSMTMKETSDLNGQKFYTTIAGCKEMVDLLATSFTLTTDAPFHPQTIQFVKSADASASFSLFASLN